ncbi:MAG: HAD-IA family hydrolase [Clostridia bacterium]|nr:HAD-IA family hydrolase [Clostridia bacterium]
METKIDKKLLNTLENKKTFIFDFDGTISSTYGILFKTLETMFKNHGFVFSLDEFNALKGKPSTVYFEKFEEVTKQKQDPQKMAEEFSEIFEQKTKTEKLFCYDYVKQLIKKFPNKNFVVASNNFEQFLSDRLVEFEIRENFSKIVACTNKLKKQYVYQNTISLFGTNPKDCALFEDDQKYINEAKKEGILTVGIVHDYNQNLDADFFIAED